MREDIEGFSLIEMMIVIALMALIGTIVTQQVVRRLDEAKVDTTKVQIRQLGTALDEFRRRCGFYPSTDQGLDSLIHAPTGGRTCKNYDPEGIIKDKKVPQDAWSNDFVYTSDGNTYKISSLGADNAPGGTGFNKDLDSDNLDE